GRNAAKDGALFPELAEDEVNAMSPPYAKHARGTPTPDVHDVLAPEPFPPLRQRRREQRKVRGLGPSRQSFVEPNDVTRVVTGGRCEEADLRPLFPGQVE